MFLTVECDQCAQRIRVGQLDNLPQTTRLMSELGNLFYEHPCVRLDKRKKSA